MGNELRRRIGINTAFLEPERRGGAETYTRELVSAIQMMQLPESFVVFAPRTSAFPASGGTISRQECRINPTKRKLRMLYEEFVLPGRINGAGLDVVHFPYGTAPGGIDCPLIVTIHDTIRFHFPGEIAPLERQWKRLNEERLRDNEAAHVICVSHWDAQSLIDNLEIPAERVTVCYHGVGGHFFRTPSANEGTPSSEGSNEILWVGRPYPRKQAELLVKAWGALKRMQPDAPTLRLVGPTEAEAARLRSILDEPSLQSQLIITPMQPHDKISQILSRTALFCYPSAYESFGLPVLEATAAGVPTLVSDLKVFHELHGDAVAYADTSTPDAFAHALDRVLSDSTELARLRTAGPANARGFTWQKTAEKTIDVYRRVCEQAMG